MNVQALPLLSTLHTQDRQKKLSALLREINHKIKGETQKGVKKLGSDFLPGQLVSIRDALTDSAKQPTLFFFF